jgi:glucosamine--fructose-6-phosphate aminotransferase (isomerizing)
MLDGTIKYVDKERLSPVKKASMATNGTIGIGHTRWATHGVPNDVTHPHLSNSGDLVIIHNGIMKLRSFKVELIKEVMFSFRYRY